jgi:lycopene cyclase domain-containing protein
LFRQSASLLYLLIALVPFGLANGILTSLPVVTYGGMEFSGIRIVTIPLEDFLYNITLLGFELLVYHRLKFRRKIYG